MAIRLHTLCRRLALVTGLTLVGTTGALAQSSATATGTATATIIRPITIAAAVDLAFGNVVASSTTGTLLVAASSGTPSQTAGGGATQPGTQKGTISAAKFDVGGEGAFTYTITLPSGAATLSSGGNSMTVDTWTSSIVTTAGQLDSTAGNLGAQSFYVGGTLNVGANQVPGNYTGTFSVTVAYN